MAAWWGQVLASRSPLFEAGQYVSQYVGGSIGWSSHGVAAADEFRLLDPGLVPLSTALGVVGMPGVTAYVGLFELGKPQPGETVVVSAASGAVGAVVGQLAKMRDCRVVGLAGTAEKCAYIVDEIGFDTAINYRAEEVVAALAAACPDGIDIYFDNVGGVILDAALQHLNYKARVPMCGAVSEYNGELQARPGPSWNRLVQTSEAILTGFRQGQFADRHEEAFAMLAMWVRSGALKYREHIVDGLRQRRRRVHRHAAGQELRQAASAGGGRSDTHFPGRGTLRTMRDFAGKVAVVTGAASGIGRGLAERFAREGMQVVLADVQADALDATVGELQAQHLDVIGVQADVFASGPGRGAAGSCP